MLNGPAIQKAPMRWRDRRRHVRRHRWRGRPIANTAQRARPKMSSCRRITTLCCLLTREINVALVETVHVEMVAKTSHSYDEANAKLTLGWGGDCSFPDLGPNFQYNAGWSNGTGKGLNGKTNSTVQLLFEASFTKRPLPPGSCWVTDESWMLLHVALALRDIKTKTWSIADRSATR